MLNCSLESVDRIPLVGVVIWMILILYCEVLWLWSACSYLQFVHFPLVVGHEVFLFFNLTLEFYVWLCSRLVVQMFGDLLENLLISFPLEVLMLDHGLRLNCRMWWWKSVVIATLSSLWCWHIHLIKTLRQIGLEVVKWWLIPLHLFWSCAFWIILLPFKNVRVWLLCEKLLLTWLLTEDSSSPVVSLDLIWNRCCGEELYRGWNWIRSVISHLNFRIFL